MESGRVVGCAIFGFFAGADRAGRLHTVLVSPTARRLGLGRALLDSAVAALAAAGARFVLAEFSSEGVRGASYGRLLAAAGFREEGRIEGYFRRRAPLVMMRRDLTARDSPGLPR